MKYQTLMARPEIGNRFICVVGCSSPLSPSLPPHTAAAAGLENPSTELEQMGCGSSQSPGPGVDVQPQGKTAFPATPEPANKTGHAPLFILVFNCNPNHNTAVKCPNNME